MSAKKKEKEQWRECEKCLVLFPRAKFSLHDQDACQLFTESADGDQRCVFGLPSDQGLPHMGFIYSERFAALCSTYKIDG